MNNTPLIESIQTLQHFISENQLRRIIGNCFGVEGQWFKDKTIELVELVKTMPKIYEQDGKGKESIVYLHYFHGGYDWYITERDNSEKQLQAFGYAIVHEGEFGYIPIQELIDNNVEIDLHWTPKTLREALKDK